MDRNEQKFRDILTDHIRRYPSMENCDLYKLLFQAAMGSSHNLSDEYEARRALVEEASITALGPSEPLVDIISEDDSIARIHIRPYGKAHGNLDSLLAVFIRTANRFQGSLEKLKLYQLWTAGMLDDHLLTDELSEVNAFLDSMGNAGFPVVHHSETFRRLYCPSYRIVAVDFLKANPDLRRMVRNQGDH